MKKLKKKIVGLPKNLKGYKDMKKYKLLKEDFIEHNGFILYRIKALKDWWNIKEGQLGGYIWKEENLSQEGACWVHKRARVYGYARVSGRTQIWNSYNDLYQQRTIDYLTKKQLKTDSNIWDKKEYAEDYQENFELDEGIEELKNNLENIINEQEELINKLENKIKELENKKLFN